MRNLQGGQRAEANQQEQPDSEPENEKTENDRRQPRRCRPTRHSVATRRLNVYPVRPSPVAAKASPIRVIAHGVRLRAVTTEWAQYVRGHLHRLGWRPADLARSIMVSESSISRWLRGAVPSVNRVRLVARVIGRPEAEAMHIAGYGTANVQRVEIRVGAEALSDDELLAEIKRRFQRSASGRLLGRPGSVPPDVLAEMQNQDRKPLAPA